MTTFRLDNYGDLRWKDRETIRQRIGRDGWTRLELAAARKVLPVWSSRYFAARVEALLDETERYLAGEAERQTVDSLADEFYVVLLGVVAQTGRQNASFAPVAAGFAAMQAARSSYDAQIGGAEWEVEPENWSASFHASVAWAGSATWERVAGSEIRRREFWTWWIAQAQQAAAAR